MRRAARRGLALLLMGGLLGCGSLPRGEDVPADDGLSALAALDSALAGSLHGYLDPPAAWPPRSAAEEGEGETWRASRTIRVSSLAWAPRLLPRLEGDLRAAGFAGFRISSANLPPGYFALIEVPLRPGLIGVYEILQEVKGRMALIIDDVGYGKTHGEILRGIDLPLTLAVLPLLPYTAYWDRTGSDLGFEIILHCPLEASNPDLDIGPGGLREEMSGEEMAAVLERDLADLPHAAGCNNHMGSSFTADTAAMVLFLQALQGRGFFFVDSLTVPGTAAAEAARATGIAVAARDVFLDHVNAPEEINAQFDLASEKALATGSAVVIGHYRGLTLEILTRRLGELAASGIQVVPVSTLVAAP